jgi:putative PIG3 family NAD(P)H quinone oxidoreductase
VIAIEISSPGGPDVLRAVERPAPEPGAGAVLVRVHAAGVNRPDILQRLGKYPPPAGASDIPGLELSGTVVRVGESADAEPPRWAPGDAVCALVSGGGYAEYAAVPSRQCLPVPAGVDLVAAAAIPETYFTVWTNLFERGQLKTGDTVLVHGGGSGIGTTAIQLATAFGGRVFATAGSAAKCDACRRLGAEAAIDYNTTDFVSAVAGLTSGRGVDIVLDIVGGDYLARNLQALAMDGRLVQIGLLGGASGALNLAGLMQKRLTITGSTLRARSVEQKAAIARALEQHVWPLLASGVVAPVVDRTFALASAADAHRALESGEVIGKVVLTTGAAPREIS